MVVVYRLSPLTYRLGKPFVKVDTYAMPNLIAGRRIVPELIQDDFTPERVADETVALLTDRDAARAHARGAARVCASNWGARARAAAPPTRCSRSARRREACIGVADAPARP